MNDKDPKVVYLPDLALFAVLITMSTWWFALYSVLGDRAPVKQWVCGSLSLVATLFLATVGRKAMGGGWPSLKRGQHIGVTRVQACWVTAWMIAAGCLHGWMFD